LTAARRFFADVDRVAAIHSQGLRTEDVLQVAAGQVALDPAAAAYLADSLQRSLLQETTTHFLAEALSQGVADAGVIRGEGSNTVTLIRGETEHFRLVADASSVTATAANYKLQVLNAVTNTALAIDAEYMGNAAHRFWQAWSEGGILQHSPTSAIRWWAQNKRALPLTIRTAGGASITQIPAQSGTYVLAIGPNAQHLPAWSTLALHATNPRNLRTLQLVSRGNSQRVPFPYLIFHVEQVV